jgi:hypothetical protein
VYRGGRPLGCHRRRGRCHPRVRRAQFPPQDRTVRDPRAQRQSPRPNPRGVLLPASTNATVAVTGLPSGDVLHVYRRRSSRRCGSAPGRAACGRGMRWRGRRPARAGGDCAGTRRAEGRAGRWGGRPRSIRPERLNLSAPVYGPRKTFGHRAGSASYEALPQNTRKSWAFLWNIMLPWNRVLTSSMSIFQTSCEHVFVVLTVCAWRAVYCT